MEILTIREASLFLGVSVSTLYKWVEGKRISYKKLGRLVKFTKADLENFLAQNTVLAVSEG